MKVLCCCGVFLLIVVLALIVMGGGLLLFFAAFLALMKELPMALGNAIGSGIRYHALGY